MRKKKRLVCLIVIFVMLCTCKVFAAMPSSQDAIHAMSGMNATNISNAPTGMEKVGNVINGAIGLIQIAGTGISIIMVTILGIKYIIATPNEKAEVKKQIMPMVIGCVILFGSVNLIQIIANFTANVF